MWSRSNYRLKVGVDKFLLTLQARRCLAVNKKGALVVDLTNFFFREGKHDLIRTLTHLHLESVIAEEDACSRQISGMEQLRDISAVLATLVILAQTLDRAFLL